MLSRMSKGPTAAPPDWLTRVADSVEEMLWVWDAGTGQLLHANAALVRFLGAEPTGKGRDVLLDRVLSEDRPLMLRMRAQLPQAGYVEEFRITQPSKGD